MPDDDRELISRGNKMDDVFYVHVLVPNRDVDVGNQSQLTERGQFPATSDVLSRTSGNFQASKVK